MSNHPRRARGTGRWPEFQTVAHNEAGLAINDEGYTRKQFEAILHNAQNERALAMHRELLEVAKRYEGTQHGAQVLFGPETDHQQQAIAECLAEHEHLIERAILAGLEPEDM